MRITTVNVNGLRSAASKGFFAWMDGCGADIVCLQETRASAEQIAALEVPPGWHFCLNAAERPGYSGVAIYSRQQPEAISTQSPLAEFETEGRYLEARFPGLRVISAYLPSGSSGAERQAAKYRYLDEFVLHLDKLARGRDEVAICGDWNIAHREIDICNASSNRRTPGFLPAERAWLTQLLTERGWVDAFRHLYPEEQGGGYTWWSNRGQAFAKNVGWRIDYQIVSAGLAGRLRHAEVYKAERFSDHAPLSVDYQDD